MGLPGLRVGWLACRDASVISRATELKQIASLCLSAPSEVLAHMAIGASETLLTRNRAIAARNLIELERLVSDHEAHLDWTRPDGGVVGYVRYRGREGVEAFATNLAREAGVLVLPASVWRSALAPLPHDRFRIGFGRKNCPAAYDAMRAAFQRPVARSAA
jgi:aspartate/methionine/tyrosine aminotransferase